MSEWPGQLLVSVLALPVTGAALCLPLHRISDRVATAWTLLVTTVTCAGAFMVSVRVSHVGPFSHHLGGWLAPWGIELRADQFGALVGLAAPVFALVVFYGVRYSRHAVEAARRGPYDALLLINLGGLLGFSFTGDLFNLFVFMELFSLSAYALVAYGKQKVAAAASFRYLVMGAFSSLLVLFSIGLLYQLTGTLNMADMAYRLADGVPHRPVVLAFGALALGFMTKAAVFPLHLWLPDAHAAAPSPVSAILSGLVVKMGIVGLIRTYDIFQGAGGVDLPTFNMGLSTLGAIAIVFGAVLALIQDDIKLMLAYSTVSNIGYIAVGLGLFNESGLTGASIHIFNHAVIKAALFLALGALTFRTGYRTVSDLRGIGRRMPITVGALSVAVISVVGVPPTAGFVTKWYLAVGAVAAARPLLAATLVFSALVMLIYYLRIVNAFYFRPAVHEEVERAVDPPLDMLAPVVLLSGASLALGLIAQVPIGIALPGVMRLLGGG